MTTLAHFVLAGPTRNVTDEAMPTSFGEALTQLSFLEFVQRCNLLIAPSQPTQLPVRFTHRRCCADRLTM